MNRLRFYLSTPDKDQQEGMRRILRAAYLLGVRSGTITPALGLWEGAMEPSYVFEIIEPVEPGSYVRASEIAEGLREAFGQDAVLLTIDRVMAQTLAKAA